MDGFLNLNKPTGFTSHDCVAKVRKLLHLKRVGHGGTLDPAATGVLPIALGKATRLLPYLPPHKAYQATIRFGVTTTTDDLEGERLTTQVASELTLDTVLPVLKQFEGTLRQIPPRYSAIKIQGKRLYDLARAGKTPDIPERIVEVYQIQVLDWRAGDFPELDLFITCGPGTYIRAIARDLGVSVDTGGVLTSLTRTQSCGLQLADSLTLDQLDTQIQTETFTPISPAIPLHHLTPIALASDLAYRWCQGQRIPYTDTIPPLATPSLSIYHPDGHFLGIGEFRQTPTETLLIPLVVFAAIDIFNK